MSKTVEPLAQRIYPGSLPDNLPLYENSIVHCSVYSKVKRFIDILGAITGLLLTVIVAIPIFIAIQWDDPGPILYSQMRCGLQGKPFRIWKFRSMVMNADKQKH